MDIFRNDYSETAHPSILKALTDTNYEMLDPYGQDSHSLRAVDLIRDKIKHKKAEIHLVAGGTQANLLVIGAALRPWEAVITTREGHIEGHEGGSIEATGHKVLLAEGQGGKLTPNAIEKVLKENEEDNHPDPRMVYISNATELGTVYTKKELTTLSEYCKSKGLYLFMDGARLGSALAVQAAKLTFADLPKYCDVFYIGGTKNGALLGEAIVFINDQLKVEFRRHMKQKGAVLAKGKVAGIQFEQLFTGDLYMELARHANAMADKLRAGISALGYGYLIETPSNQIFPIFPDRVIKKLEPQYKLYERQPAGEGNSSVRLVTSWATAEKTVDAFLKALAAASKAK